MPKEPECCVPPISGSEPSDPSERQHPRPNHHEHQEPRPEHHPHRPWRVLRQPHRTPRHGRTPTGIPQNRRHRHHSRIPYPTPLQTTERNTVNPPTLEEAAKSLTADIIRYAGPDSWQCVGYADAPNNPTSSSTPPPDPGRTNSWPSSDTRTTGTRSSDGPSDGPSDEPRHQGRCLLHNLPQ